MTDIALFPPIRAAALSRLVAFVPRAGRDYAQGRNSDPGPGHRDNVLLMSPYVRHRVTTEREVVAAAGSLFKRSPYGHRRHGCCRLRAGRSLIPACVTAPDRSGHSLVGEVAHPKCAQSKPFSEHILIRWNGILTGINQHLRRGDCARS